MASGEDTPQQRCGKSGVQSGQVWGKGLQTMQVDAKLMTVEQYQAEFAKQPIEIVDGEVIPMSPVGRRQPQVMANLADDLGPFVKRENLGRVFSEASYVLDGNRRANWVRGARTPDVSFIRRERIEAHNAEYTDPDEPWWLAPDIAVEVVSPTDPYSAVIGKAADYLRYGVKLVWIIDPQARTVHVHTPDNPMGTTLAGEDTLKAEPVIEGWSMAVAALFEE